MFSMANFLPCLLKLNYYAIIIQHYDQTFKKIPIFSLCVSTKCWLMVQLGSSRCDVDVQWRRHIVPRSTDCPNTSHLLHPVLHPQLTCVPLQLEEEVHCPCAALQGPGCVWSGHQCAGFSYFKCPDSVCWWAEMLGGTSTIPLWRQYDSFHL